MGIGITNWKMKMVSDEKIKGCAVSSKAFENITAFRTQYLFITKASAFSSVNYGSSTNRYGAVAIEALKYGPQPSKTPL